MPRGRLEARAVECLADSLFGFGNYDLVLRPGYVGAIGYLNNRPVILMVRRSGAYGSFSEFKRVYGLRPATVVIIRTSRVKAARFLKALSEHGYRAYSAFITTEEFKRLSRCDDEVANRIISSLARAWA